MTTHALGRSVAENGPRQPQDESVGGWSTARVVVTVVLLTGLLGAVATVGADSRWLAALGRLIVEGGGIPRGIPFASAPTEHWPNTLVLAELVFDGLERALGDRGLVVAQLIAVAGALGLLARDARIGGATSQGIVSSLALAALGALASLAVVRVQMFSLVLFPLMVAVLRAEARAPSRRIWLAPLLLVVWSNLHGAALSGLVLLYVYLALSRFRQDRRTAVAVALAALPALCLTPAGIRTVSYYHGLVTNLAAQRGVGQWAPLGSSPLDWVLVLAALLLLARVWRVRPAIWERAMIALLAVLTVKAGRDGVWLLFFLAPVAARRTRVRRDWNGLVPLGAALAIVLLVADVARAPVGGAAPQLISRAVGLAQGTPILADGIPAEQVALRGGRIWAGNPIDAFSRRVQAAYLDWLDGAAGGRVALAVPRVRVVIAGSGSAAARLTAASGIFRAVSSRGAVTLFLRR
jgi:hypothetical protein